MARTTRKFWTDTNWREARKGGPRYRAEREAAWDNDTPGEFTQIASWGTRNSRGGMLMSSSNSGLWSDGRHCGDTLRRTIKRGQRQSLRSELWEQVEAYFAPEYDLVVADDDPIERFPLSGCCDECESYAIDPWQDYPDDYNVGEDFDTAADPYRSLGYDPYYPESADDGYYDWREDYRANWLDWWGE